MFEEAELSTSTKINQTIQLLAVIANKPQWLYHLSFSPRPFKFETVIALSTFAGIDLAINCLCGKILFKKKLTKELEARRNVAFLSAELCQSIYFLSVWRITLWYIMCLEAALCTGYTSEVFSKWVGRRAGPCVNLQTLNKGNGAPHVINLSCDFPRLFISGKSEILVTCANN